MLPHSVQAAEGDLEVDHNEVYAVFELLHRLTGDGVGLVQGAGDSHQNRC